MSKEGPVDEGAALDELVTRVRRGLVAAYGSEVGCESAQDVAEWAWEHREELWTKRNPAGYLYRVGQSRSRRYRRQPVQLPPERALTDDTPISDGRLPAELARLSQRQRTAVLLVHAHGYSLSEAAATLGCSISSLRNHLTRGLRHLRDALEESSDR
jgi:DNA-directed RNA polymerase specialized sigma24 family protein